MTDEARALYLDLIGHANEEAGIALIAEALAAARADGESKVLNELKVHVECTSIGCCHIKLVEELERCRAKERRRVWEEAKALFLREGWDCNRAAILRYCDKQAKERTP